MNALEKLPDTFKVSLSWSNIGVTTMLDQDNQDNVKLHARLQHRIDLKNVLVFLAFDAKGTG